MLLKLGKPLSNILYKNRILFYMCAILLQILNGINLVFVKGKIVKKMHKICAYSVPEKFTANSEVKQGWQY